MNVLVIAPHPDDESIGCGGTICLHVQRGDRVSVAFLTSGELGLKHLDCQEAWRVREGEAQAAAAVLGVAEMNFLRLPDWYLQDHVEEADGRLQSILHLETPSRIYLPHAGEWHPDHAATLAVVRAALTRSEMAVPELLTYEVWTPQPEYDHVEDISAVMRRKLRAVRSYRSQNRYFRYERAVRGLNQYRGALAARRPYAEVFGSAPFAPCKGVGTS
jgi:LmbE family N-acetylglucosaminyl deacetylase